MCHWPDFECAGRFVFKIGSPRKVDSTFLHILDRKGGGSVPESRYTEFIFKLKNILSQEIAVGMEAS